MTEYFHRFVEGFLERPLWFLMITGVLLMLCALVKPDMSYDEGMWNYIAYAWKNFDLPPYVGTLENKPPGIYLVYYLSNALLGVNTWFPRALGIAALLSAGFILYKLSSLLHNKIAGAITLLIFGLTMTWNAMDGAFTAHTESFMILFTSLCFYLLVQLRLQNITMNRVLKIGAAGFCLGLGLTFKQIALFTGGAAIAMYFLFDRRAFASVKSPVRDLGIGFVGVVCGLIIGLVPLFLSHVSFSDYWHSAWMVLLEGPGNSPSSFGIRIQKAYETWTKPELALFAPMVILFFSQKENLRNIIPFYGIMAWIIMDFIGANMAGYYYGHQLKQIVPSLSVASGVTIAVLFEKDSKNLVLATVMIAFLWFIPGTYFQTFSPFEPSSNDSLKKTGLWIRHYTKQDDYVYVFGREANVIHAYAERKSPTRYFDLSFVRRTGAMDEIARDVDLHAPVLIALSKTIALPPWLETVLTEKYTCKTEVEGYLIYLRKL